MNIERRIDELERVQGIGTTRLRLVHTSYIKCEDHAQAVADAAARDEAEHGPLQSGEFRVIVACGPAGHWVSPPDGSRWQYADGTTTVDPTRRPNGNGQSLDGGTLQDAIGSRALLEAVAAVKRPKDCQG